jgi:hypothetical protein
MSDTRTCLICNQEIDVDQMVEMSSPKHGGFCKRFTYMDPKTHTAHIVLGKKSEAKRLGKEAAK